jgi:hypothetical protein
MRGMNREHLRHCLSLCGSLIGTLLFAMVLTTRIDDFLHADRFRGDLQNSEGPALMQFSGRTEQAKLGSRLVVQLPVASAPTLSVSGYPFHVSNGLK